VFYFMCFISNVAIDGWLRVK